MVGVLRIVCVCSERDAERRLRDEEEQRLQWEQEERRREADDRRRREEQVGGIALG